METPYGNGSAAEASLFEHWSEESARILDTSRPFASVRTRAFAAALGSQRLADRPWLDVYRDGDSPELRVNVINPQSAARLGGRALNTVLLDEIILQPYEIADIGRSTYLDFPVYVSRQHLTLMNKWDEGQPEGAAVMMQNQSLNGTVIYPVPLPTADPASRFVRDNGESAQPETSAHQPSAGELLQQQYAKDYPALSLDDFETASDAVERLVATYPGVVQHRALERAFMIQFHPDRAQADVESRVPHERYLLIKELLGL